MKINEENIGLFYEHFYSRKYDSKKYRFKLTPNNKGTITTFIKTLKEYYNFESLGFDFLFTYFLFHFTNLDKVTIQRFSVIENEVMVQDGKVILKDIIGKKAVIKYFHRNTDYDWIYNSSNAFCLKYSIEKLELQRKCCKFEKGGKNVSFDDKMYRKPLFNTYLGFLYCKENELSFDEESKYCKNCIFKKECNDNRSSN